MERYQVIQWSAALTGLVFFFAFGAICGSFINVLVYRLPRGLNVVRPPSACPACGTRLTWRENFPILGWLWLRGRCRFCKSPISPHYPLVELFVALLFASMWGLWFMQPSIFSLVGVRPATWRPDFAAEGFARVWPTFAVILILFGALIAGTLIDLRTFTIPLVLPWTAAAVAVVAHPLHAWWIESTGGLRASPHPWTIPIPTGPWIGSAVGGALGVGLSALLLRLRLIPRSFEDYPAWEAEALKAAESASSSPPSNPPSKPTPGSSVRTLFIRALFLTGPPIALMLGGFSLGLNRDRAGAYAAAGAGLGLLIGLVLRKAAPGHAPADSSDPIWVQYPHARRETWKELLFLTPALGLAAVGWWLTAEGGPLASITHQPPLWLGALSGSLLGLLVGGGIVWATRIIGTLALGKEAMGLGDVHLMAGVGACLGWIDPILAFFTAPFLGIAWAAGSVISGRLFHRQGTALPYGPHLAAATLAVVLLKPVYEAALALILLKPVTIP